MGKRSNFERIPRDFYPTPAAAVLPLIPHLRGVRTFAEPCCGDGALVRHLEAHGLRCVYQGDIATGQDALAITDFGEVDSIITNPPYQRPLMHALIAHFARIAPTWLLIESDWACTRHHRAHLRQRRCGCARRRCQRDGRSARDLDLDGGDAALRRRNATADRQRWSTRNRRGADAIGISDRYVDAQTAAEMYLGCGAAGRHGGGYRDELVSRMTDDQKRQIMEAAYDALDATAGLDDDIAERREAILAGDYREWQLPEQEPAPRATAAPKGPAMTKTERNEMLATVGAMINEALARREAKWANAIGRELAAERIKFREFVTRALLEQRASPDDEAAAVFDLRDERRRRSGNAA